MTSADNHSYLTKAAPPLLLDNMERPCGFLFFQRAPIAALS